MRLRRSQVNKYNLKPQSTTKNAEGGVKAVYGEAVEIDADIWAASGKVQAEMYGDRLRYIKNMLYTGTTVINENDGICVEVSATDTPDYKVISTNRKPLYELEKI